MERNSAILLRLIARQKRVVFVYADGGIDGLGFEADLSQVAIDVLPRFHEYLAKSSLRMGVKIDWWVSSFTSRNCFTSPIFFNFVCLAVLWRRQQELVGTTIITDSYFLKRTISQFVKDTRISNCKVVFYPDAGTLIYNIAQLFLTLIFALPYFLVNLFLNKRARTAAPPSQVYLFSCYAKPDWWLRDTDRYFVGLYETFSDCEKDSVFFLPRNVGTKNIFKLQKYNKIYKSGDKKVLLLEDYVKFSDCVFAYNYFLRSFTLGSNLPKWMGIDVKPLWFKELLKGPNLFWAMNSLLYYRFFYRLKEKGVTLKSFVNFHENQVFDKALHRGVRKAYPTCRNLGYQGYSPVTNFYCSLPTEYERKWGVLPDVIGLPGAGYKEHNCQFLDNPKVCELPHLRYNSKLGSFTQTLSTNSQSLVVIALPHVVDDWPLFIEAAKFIKKSQIKKIRIIIKPHPIVSRSYILRFKRKYQKGLEWSDLDLLELLQDCCLLVSGASGSLIEAMANSTPVIVLQRPGRVLLNPIPLGVPRSMWAVADYSNIGVESNRKITFYYENSSEVKEMAKKIRTNYFNRNTMAGMRNFRDFIGFP